MERKAQDELMNLFRDAIKVGGAAIEMRVRRFASFVRASDEELAQSAAALVTGSSRSLRRDAVATPFPVDSDTKLPLVRVEEAGTPRPEPLLKSQTRAEVDRVVLERTSADKLMAAGLLPARSVLMSGPPGVGKTMTASWLDESVSAPSWKFFTGKTSGNVRGAAPKKTWPEYSSSSETPMAVMRTLSVAAPRSGR